MFFTFIENLPTVIMSDFWLINTRNSHAKHNKSVGSIPCVPQHQQKRVAQQRNEMSSKNTKKITSVANLQTVVRSDFWLIATHNSHAKHNESVVAYLAYKGLVTGGMKLQKIELTFCSHVELFVDSNPKFTCQIQSISGLHTSRTWGSTSKN